MKISILIFLVLSIYSVYSIDAGTCAAPNGAFFTNLEFSYWATYSAPYHTLNFRLVKKHQNIQCLSFYLESDLVPSYKVNISNVAEKVAINQVDYVSLSIDLTLSDLKAKSLCAKTTESGYDNYKCNLKVVFYGSYDIENALVIMLVEYNIALNTNSNQEISLAGKAKKLNTEATQIILQPNITVLYSNDKTFPLTTNFTGNFTYLSNIYIREKNTDDDLKTLYYIKVSNGALKCNGNSAALEPTSVYETQGWYDWSFQMLMTGQCYLSWTTTLYQKPARFLERNRITAESSDYIGVPMQLAYTITIAGWGALIKISIGLLSFILLLI